MIPPLDTVHRTVVMALERGQLAELLFDDRTLASHRILGAVLGGGLSYWAVDLLTSTVNNLANPIPAYITFDIDARVLAFTVGATEAASSGHPAQSTAGVLSRSSTQTTQRASCSLPKPGTMSAIASRNTGSVATSSRDRPT